MQTHRLTSVALAIIVAVVGFSQAAYTDDLVPLPPHPTYQEWPDAAWPPVHPSEGFSKVELGARIARAFVPDAPAALKGIRAVVVIRGGGLAAEAYADGFGLDTKLVSWSVAKSFTHAVAGLMVKDGQISLNDRLPVPEWQSGPDPRSAITLDHALRMSSGLEFSEDYVNLGTSDVINMLFGQGFADMGAYTASKPLLYEPGTHWSYSSGTTNMISRVMRDLSGGTEGDYRAFLDTRLFDPLGITSAEPEFDNAGTLIGSSLLFMTARDYARFGLFYMRDGVWRDERLLPEGWVDHGRTETPASGGAYGAHWWLRYADPARVRSAHIAFPRGTFMARGHEGQNILVVPSKDVVLVCLSLSNEIDLSAIQDYLAGIVSVFPDIERRKGEEENSSSDM